MFEYINTVLINTMFNTGGMHRRSRAAVQDVTAL